MTESALRRWRKARGWTLSELANKVGVDPSTVCRWELGGEPSAGDAVKLLAVAKELTLKDLVRR